MVLKYLFNLVFIGNKAKGPISKRVLRENKARQIFRKTNIFYPLIRNCISIKGLKNVKFGVLLDILSGKLRKHWCEIIYYQ